MYDNSGSSPATSQSAGPSRSEKKKVKLPASQAAQAQPSQEIPTPPSPPSMMPNLDVLQH